MKLTMLGTGNALVTECYNSCFVLSEGKDYFLVNGGGGSTILRQLKDVSIDWKEVKNIFVTHKFVDHLMGVIWLIRMACLHMKMDEYEGEIKIYAPAEVIDVIYDISNMVLHTLEAQYIGKRVHLIAVDDGEERVIINHKIVFFDIRSIKDKQYGFSIYLKNGEKFTCCGDEPYNPCEKEYVENSKWLMHEAFCLYSEAEIFKPYKKYHATVKEAGQLAEKMNIENLILYHTEDKHIKNRKELYTKEASQYFKGKIYVPDDLESIEL